jgi:hypothetical protein
VQRVWEWDVYRVHVVALQQRFVALDELGVRRRAAHLVLAPAIPGCDRRDLDHPRPAGRRDDGVYRYPGRAEYAQAKRWSILHKILLSVSALVG